jgi:dephospho-CoA kinase
MLVIGIVGGVASGKSLIAKQLEDCGAKVLDADRVGHEVLNQKEVKEAIRDRWGDRVFDTQGGVDRRAIAEIVFAAPPSGFPELNFLEQLTHPRIKLALRNQLDTLAAQGTKVAVLDAAVMIKSGWDQICDKILFIDVPYPVRLNRAKQRGWTEAALVQREASQVPLETKRARADQTIDNSGTLEQTREQVEAFWKTLDSGK